ncbi:YfcZ/YiiS family protein [Tatumella morbirosei]|uniref:YfcZ/YiiS family protein n=1 Tax=Tatumella morbirosei TaxID=642227 RepID=UPI000A04D990|nr:YfcZ/YiiS family protein [Tatumella morbirosei]
MTDAIKKCSANETAACCCVDVGTVMDNSDCTASWSASYADRNAAESALATLTAKARAIESSPCEIQAEFNDQTESVRLDAEFIFSCQAESMIFQLGLR